MALFISVILATVVLVYIALKIVALSRKAKTTISGCQLPGPKGLPFLGIAHKIPLKCSWMKFAEWAEEYGPIYQVNIAGENHVWISRDSVAHDLLSKRSAIYSDRPFIPALEYDNRTSGQYLPLMSKNLIWSRQRRFAKQIMDKSEQESFYSYPEMESMRLLFELMVDPARYNHAMESYVARVTSRLAWGTPTASDKLKQRARELLIGVSPSGALGNRLPPVMSLPERLSKPKAWELRRGRTEQRFFEIMQDEVKQSIEQGDKDLPSSLPKAQAKRSWTSMYLEHKQGWGFTSDVEASFAVGMHGIAGALTIAAPMQAFCLAMCHYPQYQSTLHEEIDRVLGDRMPTFADMPEMPVLRAFIRETMRWRPPVPTGIPHALIQDDVYEGYHIPKGSVIHPLEWSISRDPEVFPKPDDWNPMRWLDPKYPTYQEPLSRHPTITQYSQFGYGRRTCQGMAVTEADLFVGLGSVAWLFSIHADDQTVAEDESQHQSSAIGDGDSGNGPADSSSLETPNDNASSSSESGVDFVPFDDDIPADIIQRPQLERLSANSYDSAICMLSANDSASESTKPFAHDRSKAESTMNESDPPSRTVGSALDDLNVDNSHTETVSSLFFAKYLPSWRSARVEDVKEKTAPPKTRQAPLYETDPTFKFSTLLIAKPLPFKFNLVIRSQVRAELVAQGWVNKKLRGEYPDARVYWKNGVKGDAECGWGEVYS